MRYSVSLGGTCVSAVAGKPGGCGAEEVEEDDEKTGMQRRQGVLEVLQGFYGICLENHQYRIGTQERVGVQSVCPEE